MTPGAGVLDLHGRRIAWRSAGQGPAVVLLHCSSSHSGQWKGLMAALAPGFTVIAPDFAGYGRSDPLPRDGRAYFDHDMEAVAALIGMAGGPAVVVGHSLGGTVALHLAVRRPELVRALVLVEPVQFAVLEETGDALLPSYARLSLQVTTLAHLGLDREAARAFIDWWSGPGAFDAMDPATADYAVATIPRAVDDWAGVTPWAPGQLTLADIARIAVPCHLVLGAATRPEARAIVGHLAEAIPGATVGTIPGGHLAAAAGGADGEITAFLDRLG